MYAFAALKKTDKTITMSIYISRKDKYMWCRDHKHVMYESVAVKNNGIWSLDITRDNTCNSSLIHALVY